MKSIVLSSLASLCLASCFSVTMDRQIAATYHGAVLGGMIGSAMGDLAGGPRSSALGNAIGMVAGGVIGHATTAPNLRTRRHDLSRSEVVTQWTEPTPNTYHYKSPHNTNTKPSIAIEAIAVYEDVTDGILAPEERVEIVFVLHNTTSHTLTNIVPLVRAMPDKHLLISPSQPINMMPPRSQMRYTAFVYVKRSIKRKPITFSIAIDHHGHITDEKRFTLQGRKATH